MEKADILEMSVKYIKDKQLQEEKLVQNVNQAVYNGYREGYRQCLQEITNILSTNPYICEQVKNDIYIQLSAMNQSTDRVERSTPSTAYSDRTTPPTGHKIYSSHSSAISSVSDHSSVSSGYLSSYCDRSLESISRVGSISDSYSSVPLTSSTPTQIKHEADTAMGSPVSPFVQYSPFNNQHLFNYGYVGQYSDDSVFHGNSDSSSNHSNSIPPSPSMDTVKSEPSDMWRPW